MFLLLFQLNFFITIRPATVHSGSNEGPRYKPLKQVRGSCSHPVRPQSRGLKDEDTRKRELSQTDLDSLTLQNLGGRLCGWLNSCYMYFILKSTNEENLETFSFFKNLGSLNVSKVVEQTKKLSGSTLSEFRKDFKESLKECLKINRNY